MNKEKQEEKKSEFMLEIDKIAKELTEVIKKNKGVGSVVFIATEGCDWSTRGQMVVGGEDTEIVKSLTRLMREPRLSGYMDAAIAISKIKNEHAIHPDSEWKKKCEAKQEEKE